MKISRCISASSVPTLFKSYYAVARGSKVGVFNTWPECEKQVTGFKGALHKKFANLKDAEEYIRDNREDSNLSSSTSVPFPNPVDITNSATSGACYAVARGHTVGIFFTWNECEKQMTGFDGAYCKKFDNPGDAEAFIEANREHSSANSFLSGTSGGILKRFYEATMEFCGYSKGHVKNCGSSKQFEQGPIVYTDGSCTDNGTDNAKAGCGVFWGDGHKNNLAAPLEGKATNNRAEYTAVIVALKQAIDDGHSHITIRTDSKLLVNSMTQWLPSWKRNDFMKTDGTPILNVDLITELDNLMQMICVKFEHVNGHAGIYGNEMADQLARKGSQENVR